MMHDKKYNNLMQIKYKLFIIYIVRELVSQHRKINIKKISEDEELNLQYAAQV